MPSWQLQRLQRSSKRGCGLFLRSRLLNGIVLSSNSRALPRQYKVRLVLNCLQARDRFELLLERRCGGAAAAYFELGSLLAIPHGFNGQIIELSRSLRHQ